MSTRERSTIVEFSDRTSDYWEVLTIPLGAKSVLGRAYREADKYRGIDGRPVGADLSVTYSRGMILLEFNGGEHPEAVATLFAMSLGWIEADGAVIVAWDPSHVTGETP